MAHNNNSAQPTTDDLRRKSCPDPQQASDEADEILRQGIQHDHFENLQQFVTEFKKVIPGLIAKNPKYDRVKVLLFYWEDGEPDMKKEAKGLMNIFHDGYGFAVEEFIIPANEKADSKFMLFLIAEIVKIGDEDGENKLLILYYGGHGEWDKEHNTHLWKPVREKNHRLSEVSIPLEGVRCILKTAGCDLLLLLDCCFSLAMMGDDFACKRRTWLLAAAGNVEKAGGTPGKTWTAAITHELKGLKDSGGVSVSQLHDILVRYDKMQGQHKLSATPHIRRWSAPSWPSDIFIEVHKEQSEGRGVPNVTKQPQKLQTDARMLIKIAFRNPADELKRSLWEYWFRGCPPNFSDVELAISKQIEVVHLFEANSCLLLVTMPCSLWAFFPPHPAYDCIGMVRAPDDIVTDIFARSPDWVIFPPHPAYDRSGMAIRPTTMTYPMPGFTAEQTASLQAMITAAIDDAISQAMPAFETRLTAFETRLTAIEAKFRPTEYQVTAPQHRPWQQSIVEKTAEKPTEKTAEKQSIASSSDNDNTGTLSTIPHQATMHYCRESSPRHNGAPFSTLASQLASQLASPPDYIHYGKGMEATGQG
ncbi:hypothetical protein HO133_009630 [Letharia lupina]|uniref:Uncharacterized protein n=1 Tax=Letharia lupina TaxID=560253 RepID=A0A8H6CL30_9LECA|nr:uncharacterized protein HO133_009630 [Letharia lupina]KAF6225630.1 hypothetical protein HO133_009630 [Letharia lupina]